MKIEKHRGWLVALAAALIASPAAGQQGPDFPDLPVVDLPFEDLRHWAVALPVMFEGGQWQPMDEPIAQACHGPSDAGYTGKEGASLLRVVDAQGAVLRERRVGNPRIVLPEAPGFDEDWQLAGFAEATLSVGLAEGATVLQFFADAERPEQPDLEVDVREAVEIAKDHAAQVAPACQGNNPPVVPIGSEGRYVLAYAVQYAASSVDVAPSELLALLGELPMWQLNRRLPRPLPVRARQMLADATVER